MVGEVFTEAEETLLVELKSAFYYSNNNIYLEAKNLLRGLDNERASELMETVLSQLGFEQKQRREYILSYLGIDINRPRVDETEVFIHALAAYGTDTVRINQFVSEANLDKSIFISTRIDEEAVKESRVFSVVSNNIKDFFSRSIYQKRIKAIISPLSRASDVELRNIVAQLKDYVTRVKQLGDEIIVTNPDYSNAVIDLFDRIGLGLTAKKMDTVGSRLSFCGDVLVAASYLLSLRESGTEFSDSASERAIGDWIYNIEGSTTAEDALEN
jgi:hypothetical protein